MDSLETPNLTHAILSSAGIGLWTIELDSGKSPRMYADSAFLQILGFPEETLPEDLYNLWCNNIDLSYYEAFAESIEQMTNGETSELEYAWNHQSRGIIFLKIHGGRNNDYKAGVRLEGCCIDVTEQLEFKMHLRELEQYSNIANTLGDGFDNIYYVNTEDNSFVEFNAQGIVKTLDIKAGGDFFEGLEQALEKAVYRDDWNTVSDFVRKENLLSALEKDRAISMAFRFLIDGQPVFYRLKAARTPDSDNRIVVTLENVDEEESAKAERAREEKFNDNIIKILSRNYSGLYLFNTKSNTGNAVSFYQHEQGRENDGSTDIVNRLLRFVQKRVHPDDRHELEELADLETIRKKLATVKSYSVVFRCDYYGVYKYTELTLAKAENIDEEPVNIAVGYAEIDAQYRAELERQAVANRDMAVISGLSDDFGCVVYVDYETLAEAHYRFDPLFEKYLPGWSKIDNFGTRLDVLVNTIVHPGDRETFQAATEPSKVLEMVEKEHLYFVNFRLQLDDEDVYYQIKFVKDENFKNHVIAGFHSVDAETKREMANLEKAELANKAKSAFLFNMSHDIRTPLNAMLGFTDMAIKNIDDKPKALDCLKKSKLSSEHLLSLVNDVLDMSRIESGKVELDLNPVNIEENGDDYVPMLKSLAEKKNVGFRFVRHDIQNRYVYVDFLRLNQVLINIVSNAVKYTPSGGFVSVDITQIPSDREGFGMYEFVVIDTGIGMSKEYQTHLFDEFSRERTSTVSKQQGTGLGLAISKRIIDMMEGSIEVESEVGKGSKFTIRIPMRLQENPEAVEQVRFAHSEEETISFEGFKVLVVEDNELNLEISRDILESAGIVVESAEDGSVAVNRLKEKGPDYYDCILMDIQMPVMDGFEATRNIRQMFPDKRIPIIALSANAFDEDRHKSIEAGMDGHLAKPIVIAQLEDALKKFLKK